MVKGAERPGPQCAQRIHGPAITSTLHMAGALLHLGPGLRKQCLEWIPVGMESSLLDSETGTMEVGFSKTCLPEGQGESQVPGEKALASALSGRVEGCRVQAIHSFIC